MHVQLQARIHGVYTIFPTPPDFPKPQKIKRYLYNQMIAYICPQNVRIYV